MAIISFSSSGSFGNTEKFLKAMSAGDILRSLDQYGRRGVDALRSATPVESGLTAELWSYEVEKSRTGYSITWSNTHSVSGVNIAVILQYGHGTGTGGYVSGRDYINPAIRPIFDQIADDVWKEVTSA